MSYRGRTEHCAIDLVKFIMAMLVIGIHTEPFAGNVWLDRGFGIVTRFCLPFFFIAGAYFFFRSGKTLRKYIGRLFLLYVIWSVIYLPFDFAELSEMRVLELIKHLFWEGSRHGLWYLMGTIAGTLIVTGLRKVFSTKIVVGISLALLLIGCACSTFAPLTERIGGGQTMCGRKLDRNAQRIILRTGIYFIGVAVFGKEIHGAEQRGIGKGTTYFARPVDN